MRWRLHGVGLAFLAALMTVPAVIAAVAVAHALRTWPGSTSQPMAPTALPPALPADLLALGFTPPAAGTYQLERILQVPNGRVLDSDGSAHSLREFTTGKVTLFSFIYTFCTDARGCPLAYATLHALRELVARDPALRGQVRFVSMSFDPQFDTPAMMRSYGGGDATPGPVPWHFLTTASRVELAPLLRGFGQDVAVLVPGQAGQRAPVLSHLLKVYLIDQAGVVREIYAPAYLHPSVLYNDIVTVLAHVTHRPARPSANRIDHQRRSRRALATSAADKITRSRWNHPVKGSAIVTASD